MGNDKRGSSFAQKSSGNKAIIQLKEKDNERGMEKEWRTFSRNLPLNESFWNFETSCAFPCIYLL